MNVIVFPSYMISILTLHLNRYIPHPNAKYLANAKTLDIFHFWDKYPFTLPGDFS